MYHTAVYNRTAAEVERMSKILMCSFVFYFMYALVSADVCISNRLVVYFIFQREFKFYKCYVRQNEICQRNRGKHYCIMNDPSFLMAIHTGMYWLMSFDWLLVAILLRKPNGTYWANGAQYERSRFQNCTLNIATLNDM